MVSKIICNVINIYTNRAYWYNIMNYYKNNILKIFKLIIQITIISSFVFLFLKLFSEIPNRLYIKAIFCLVYLWFTIGIIVNLIYPIIKFINRKIE